MSVLQELGTQLGEAGLRLWIHPLYLAGMVLILLYVQRQIRLERRLFNVRLHHLFREGWRLVVYGLAAGLIASLLMAFIGSAITGDAVLLLWGTTVILLLFRVRFLCMVYSAGVIGMVKPIMNWLPADVREGAALGWLHRLLEQTHAPALLALAGVLHLTEAFLVGWQGRRMAVPVFFEGKRGKLVGGYQLNGFWPVPLFLLVPAAILGSRAGIDLPWAPLFGLMGDAGNGAGAGSGGGWALLTVPVMIGFSERTVSRLPGEKSQRSSRRLAVYAVGVIVLAWLAQLWSFLLLPAAILAIGLHELLIWAANAEEEKRIPLFVHDGLGMKILAVLPDSPAEALGLVAGESIDKVNGVRVRSRESLHHAMQINPAFCRMEVVNLAGHSKFVSRAIFAGDHHQLGIILCPDEDARYYVELHPRRRGLFALLAQGWRGRVSGSSSSAVSGDV